LKSRIKQASHCTGAYFHGNAYQTYCTPRRFAKSAKALSLPVQLLIKKAISEIPFVSVLKRVFMQNLSNENEFDLHEKELVDGSHFH